MSGKSEARSVSSVGTKNLTVQEIQVIESVFNADDGRGSGIKDLRLNEGIVRRLREVCPPTPAQVPPKFANPRQPSPEEVKEFQRSNEEYNKVLTKYLNESVEVALSDIECGVVRARLSSFASFKNDPRARSVVIAICDKFGVE